jgi:hypothetical protein
MPNLPEKPHKIIDPQLLPDYDDANDPKLELRG